MKTIAYGEELVKCKVYNKECPIIYALQIIGQKWKLPILWHLAGCEMLHYNELKRHISGITNTALTRCLRELEGDGLVNRYQHDTIPPSVEYRLTDRGKALLPTLNELYFWGKDQIDLNNKSAESIKKNSSRNNP